MSASSCDIIPYHLDDCEDVCVAVNELGTVYPVPRMCPYLCSYIYLQTTLSHTP